MQEHYLVIGAGLTGRSVLRFLSQDRPKAKVSLFDTREKLPQEERLLAEFPSVHIHAHSFPADLHSSVTTVVLSPGVAPDSDFLNPFAERKTPIISDIALFARHATKPIIGITGTNGKSTVTAMVTHILNHMGYQAKAGGNYGVPALDLLVNEQELDFHVLELSSFQLESTDHLPLKVGCMLNLSPDHLDRHHTMEEYQRCKQRIYAKASVAVWNRLEPTTKPPSGISAIDFGNDMPTAGQFGMDSTHSPQTILFGGSPLLRADSLKIAGAHNLLNVQSALAIVLALGLEVDKASQAIQSFEGLPHRCERVSHTDETIWINDSKSTNLSSTLAAVLGLQASYGRSMILLMGGRSKGNDFAELRGPLAQYVSRVICFGECRHELAKALHSDELVIESVQTLEQAVSLAKMNASPRDMVLLSPACASFDQYDNYIQRGEHFRQLVANNENR